jgi:hypothetical protein
MNAIVVHDERTKLTVRAKHLVDLSHRRRRGNHLDARRQVRQTDDPIVAADISAKNGAHASSIPD